MSDASRLLKLRSDLQRMTKEATDLEMYMLAHLLEMASLELKSRMAQVRPEVWGSDGQPKPD